MDSDDYYNIDIRKVINFLKEETIFKKITLLINKQKKNLCNYHYPRLGNAVNLLDLVKICKKRNIKIIEDASESLGTFYKK